MRNALLVRRLALAAVAGGLLSIWAFPVLWALLTSFKTGVRSSPAHRRYCCRSCRSCRCPAT